MVHLAEEVRIDGQVQTVFDPDGDRWIAQHLTRGTTPENDSLDSVIRSHQRERAIEILGRRRLPHHRRDDLATAVSDNLDFVEIPRSADAKALGIRKASGGDDAAIDLHQLIAPEPIKSQFAVASDLQPNARAVAEFLRCGFDEISGGNLYVRAPQPRRNQLGLGTELRGIV